MPPVASATVTSWPRSAAARATARPMTPAPTTRTCIKRQRARRQRPARAAGTNLVSFGGDPVRGHAFGLDHDLDGVVDAVLGIADRGRQIVEREGMSVNPGRVEALLRHEGFGAMG